jgi:hypothetical protein
MHFVHAQYLPIALPLSAMLAGVLNLLLILAQFQVLRYARQRNNRTQRNESEYYVRRDLLRTKAVRTRRNCTCRIMAYMATTDRTPTKGNEINANATKSRTAAAEANPKSVERIIERTRRPGCSSTSRDVHTDMYMSLTLGCVCSWPGGISSGSERRSSLALGLWSMMVHRMK